MHSYSVDVDRKIKYFTIAAVSILISSLINHIISDIFSNSISFSLTSISVFGLVFLLFDKFIWKLKVLHKLGIVKTPNLNGHWTGILKSSYNNFQSSMPANLTIKQTWTQIWIKGQFNQSSSDSFSASIKTNNGGRIILQYSYGNTNDVEKRNDTMTNHSGSCFLEFEPSQFLLNGKYFNEPPYNQNYGKLELTKTKKIKEHYIK